MKKCANCHYSYVIDVFENYVGCRIVDRCNNISLKVLGEKGKCPYFLEEISEN